jgi:hypothetical protein
VRPVEIVGKIKISIIVLQANFIIDWTIGDGIVNVEEVEWIL